MIPKKYYLGLFVMCFSFLPTAFAQRDISAGDFRERLEGMWLGQLMGNYAGRQVEGKTIVTFEGDDPVSKPITEYQVQWEPILQGQYYNKNGVLSGYTTRWEGDDDTNLEFLYAYSLQNQSSLTPEERTTLWTNNISQNGLYVANKQSWIQMNTYGQSVEESGSPRYNMHSIWSIDSQITTETLGALAVGMRQQAADLAGDFGGITNNGYSLHAAQFYAAMYSDAPFTSNVETLVNRGLEVVPEGSWTRDIVTKAQELYDADKADDGILNNWLSSRNAIIDFAGQKGRYRHWVESSSNTGLTTLAILYGQGNFVDTVEYGVRGGNDSDCNPATAGGLVGMMKGTQGIMADLSAAGYTNFAFPDVYNDQSTIVLPQSYWAMDDVLDIFQAATEKQILDGGGSISDPGTGLRYFLPDAGTGLDEVFTEILPEPTGPRGLVGAVLAGNGEVDVVVKRNGWTITSDPDIDRFNQAQLIDGIIDVSNNGVLPFSTYDGNSSSQQDTYEIHFDQEVTFESLILHEGDIRESNINEDPSVYEPLGGYFLDGTLVVEILRNGQWVPVTNIVFSEAFIDLEYYQSIGITFDPIFGQAIRISGSAGGSLTYTAFTEIEVFGAVPEPATAMLCLVGSTLTILRRRRMKRP